MSRLMKIAIFSLSVILVAGVLAVAATQQPVPLPKTFALEGIFKVHPKYLYKFYLTGFGNGQSCALLGDDILRNIKPDSRIYVEGQLGTKFHAGGTEQDPSPFPRTYYIYMKVEKVKVISEPDEWSPATDS